MLGEVGKQSESPGDGRVLTHTRRDGSDFRHTSKPRRKWEIKLILRAAQSLRHSWQARCRWYAGYMFLVSLTGFAAGTLCTLAYLPQALHSFRSKAVRDLSLLMLISLNLGLVLWVGYGFMIHSLPIILPNAVTFFLSAPLLMMKLRYRESVEGAKTG